MNLKKNYRFFVKNYFIVIFFVIVSFVGFVSFLKLFYSKPTYIFAKIKLGQGLWWAQTQKPNLWFAQAIKKGDIEYDFLGRTIAEILNIKYYPYFVFSGTSYINNNQYDVYITARLKVQSNQSNKQYSFKRATIAVGSSINLDLPKTNVTGTVIELSRASFQQRPIKKTIYLVFREGYRTDFPYLFDMIKIGDKYFDGSDDVFEIIDKYLDPVVVTSANLYGQISEQVSPSKKNIVVKAKIMVQQKNNQLVYGEESELKVGSPLNLVTPNFNFGDFYVSKIE